MRRPTITFASALTLLLAALPFAFAQSDDVDAPAFRLAFVDTQALIRAHPAAAEIEGIGQRLDQELEELLTQRDQLLRRQQEAGELGPEDQELLEALQVTIETRREGGLSEIRQAAAPAEQAANEIIRDLAAEGGYALILDIEASSGLVVFKADFVPDLTEEAIVMMEERHGAAD